MSVLNRLPWALLALLCLGVGLYPGVYLLAPGKFGLLQSKSDSLLGNPLWRIGFYTHILWGGIALSIGWVQFIQSWRKRHVRLHRFLGKLYLLAVGISSLAAIGISPASSTGWIAGFGFGSLGLVWFLVTWMAYLRIRKGDFRSHESWSIYSYSACFAAVTLRLWLPLMLGVLRLDFSVAYPIVAWLCWLPNLLVACWITSGFPIRGQGNQDKSIAPLSTKVSGGR
jgi:uncharacterized membrane protein